MPLTTDEMLLSISRDIIERFDKASGGVHPGFRPGHAKGILLTGTFIPSSEAAHTRFPPPRHLHSGHCAPLGLRRNSNRPR